MTKSALVESLTTSLTPKFAAWIADQRAKFDADVKDWYENGDGRLRSEGGKGYRYPQCFHGVSTWVDYDCACWQCEDGRSDEENAEAMAYERALRLEGLINFQSSGIPNDLIYTDEAMALMKKARELTLALLEP